MNKIFTIFLVAILFLSTGSYSVPLSKACPTTLQETFYKNGKLKYVVQDAGSWTAEYQTNSVYMVNNKRVDADSVVIRIIYK